MAAESIPGMMKALVCDAKGQPLELRQVPTPKPVPGTALVRVLFALCNRSIPGVVSGKIPFEIPTPMVPGSVAVGRVVAAGPDAARLAPGQLVLLDPFVRARDDPDVQILWGIYGGPSAASQRLMRDNWASCTYAEYVLAPLENAAPLDEQRLCGSPSDGGLGYAMEDLVSLGTQLVPYGGLRALAVQAGETVVVAPATGFFSGAAVGVADAMGATVIAAGRNLAVLERLRAVYPRIKIVQFKGDVQADTAALKAANHGRPIDAYVDISPAEASASTHVRSCFLALKQYGRVALMGVITADIALPYHVAVWNNISIRGQYMYERDDIGGLVRMAETGVLKLGAAGGWRIIGRFSLEDIDSGFKSAAENKSAGDIVLVTP